MKIFDPKHHLPVGWDWEVTRNYLIWGHILSGLSIFSFIGRFSDALSNLYIHIQQLDGTLVRQLDPTRTIAPFRELMAGLPYLGLGCFLLVMAAQIRRYYSYHSRDTMAIYTMRRLPDKWELHRRCWTQPLLSSAAELLLFAVLTALCWLLWRFATPAVCLPM